MFSSLILLLAVGLYAVVKITLLLACCYVVAIVLWLVAYKLIILSLDMAQNNDRKHHYVLIYTKEGLMLSSVTLHLFLCSTVRIMQI